ncbi:MAG: hypothetical protein JWL66_1680 [Sphingomonadales bacterium]|nr:hypothetical protein [Sphingomonadales bacterium]
MALKLKTCSECREEINARASVCPHCQSKQSTVLRLCGATLFLVGIACLWTAGTQPSAKPAIATLNSAQTNGSGALAKEFDPESLIPSDAPAAESATMRAWYRQNDLCRGSSDSATINTMCPQRDQSEAILQKRGWCWAYDDDTVYPPDYKWHRCSQKTLPLAQRTVRPDIASQNGENAQDGTRSFVDELEASATGAAAGGTRANQQAFKAGQLAASPALRNFEALIKARNIDLSTAEVVVSCGFRNKAWSDRIRARIAKSFSSDPVETAAKAALTQDEHEVSKAYIGGVMAAHERFMLGDDKNAGCRSIADAPFLSAFDDYAADISDTLPGGAEALKVAGSRTPKVLAAARPVKPARGTALQGRIRDARAMVQESWEASGSIITSIEVGYRCDLLNRLQANVALQRLQNLMQSELNNAGLIGDPTMSIDQITERHVLAAKAAVQNGVCSGMTPAMRGRLRAMAQF